MEEICDWCKKRVRFWQRKTEVIKKGGWSYYHKECAEYYGNSRLFDMIIELQNLITKDIPPTKEEIKSKGFDDWCSSAYKFYRLEGESHEEAREGAFSKAYKFENVKDVENICKLPTAKACGLFIS